MRDPWKALKEHYSKIVNIYSEDKILGIFLYGSQNYNIATETSDVDSIAILIPSLEEVILKDPISKEYHFENGEHCIVKDIREIIKMWKKQNINFLEILFTDYFNINFKYINYWHDFLAIRNEIVYYDVAKVFNSISGQAKHTYLQKPKDRKNMANALRMYNFLKAYLAGVSYKDCLTVNSNYIFDIKTGKIPITTVIQENLFDKFDELQKASWNVTSIPEVGKQMDSLLVKLIKENEYTKDFKTIF